MEELAAFLLPPTRPDVRQAALAQVLGLTGSENGLETVAGSPAALAALVSACGESASPALVTDALLALVNLSAHPPAATNLLSLVDLVSTLYRAAAECQNRQGGRAVQVLSNLTRDLAGCRQVVTALTKAGVGIATLVDLLSRETGPPLDYLAPLLSNLSQLPACRAELLQPAVLPRLLPFLSYQQSTVRRGGAIGAVRNCCFDTSQHPWLMGPEVELVSRLLLPLAGPTPEDWEDEEVERLPVDLQYLGEDKEREQDTDLRVMLLESLTQLCATRQGRQRMREQNVYLVLRQYHKDEEDRGCLLATENLVDILIKTEEEIKIDNYKEVAVPENVIDKLNKMDECYLNDN